MATMRVKDKETISSFICIGTVLGFHINLVIGFEIDRFSTCRLHLKNKQPNMKPFNIGT